MCGRLSKRIDDLDEMLTSADESELDPLQWKDDKDAADKDAMSNSNALEFDDDVEWSKDFDRDSQSPVSHKRGSRVRCVIVALLVALLIAGVCAAVLLLHRRMQGALLLQASADRLALLVAKNRIILRMHAPEIRTNTLANRSSDDVTSIGARKRRMILFLATSKASRSALF